jgi:hypothetical protein
VYVIFVIRYHSVVLRASLYNVINGLGDIHEVLPDVVKTQARETVQGKINK